MSSLHACAQGQPQGRPDAASLLDLTTVRLVGVAPAGQVIPSLKGRRFLHAGPPIGVSELPAPTRGALIGALLFEGEARDAKEAADLLEQGDLDLVPCQDAGAVGAITGIVSESMPVVVVQADRGGTAFSPLNEGMGRALRFGVYDEPVLRRLAWLRDLLSPMLDRAIRSSDIEITELEAEGLRRGDECHNRTVATAAVLMLRLAPALFTSAGDAAAATAVLEWIRQNPHFFVPVAMAAAKAITDRAQGIPGSPIVTGMGGNGVRVGIRVSGLDGRWFTAPAPVAKSKLFSGFTPADVQPALGDSMIIETVGLGGCALSAAPALCAYAGGTIQAASELVAGLRRITAAESSRFRIPYDDFRGTPLGIDVRRVMATGIAPVSVTGLVHRQAGVGQVGAGLTWLPLAPFERAAAALAAQTKPVRERDAALAQGAAPRRPRR